MRSERPHEVGSRWHRVGTARLGVTRVIAWLVDWACIVAWLAVLAVVGVVLDSGSWKVDPVHGQSIVAVLTVVPVTLWLAWSEARGGTPGKRLLGLTVVGPDGRPPGFARALARNIFKVGLPWQLGHLLFAYFMLSPDAESVPVWVYVASTVTWAMMIWDLAALFVGSANTPYDLIAGTRVFSRQVRTTTASSDADLPTT